MISQQRALNTFLQKGFQTVLKPFLRLKINFYVHYKPFFMHNEPRNCPQCGDVFEGRPNKIFCGKPCKGRHFRENNTLAPQIESITATTVHSVKASVSSHHPVYISQRGRDDEEQWDKEEAEERRVAELKQAAKLHEQFCGVVRDFLEAEGKALQVRPTKRLLQKVSDLTAAYQAHPHIKLPENQVNGRLKALYGIQDVLQEVIQEIESKVLWQSKESDFEITKKWRKALRELLIPD